MPTLLRAACRQLHLYDRCSGLARERIALSQQLAADGVLPAVLVQIQTCNERRHVLDAAVSLAPAPQRPLGSALRAGLACSTKPFVAVFDADYVHHPIFCAFVCGRCSTIRISPLFKLGALFRGRK
jgi:hypothetical protein